MRRSHPEAGFNLPEVMVAMAIMLVIAGAATTALLKLGSTQATIWNRTQMHSGIRGATEVLQQEVGQAGKVSLPSANVTLTTAIGGAGTASPTISSVAGMYVGEKLTIDAGCSDTLTPCTSRQEVVTVTACTSATNTACTSGGTESITAAFETHAKAIDGWKAFDDDKSLKTFRRDEALAGVKQGRELLTAIGERKAALEAQGEKSSNEYKELSSIEKRLSVAVDALEKNGKAISP